MPACISPEAVRVGALAGVIRHVASTPMPSTENAVFRAVQADLDLPEERCGLEILMAMALLTRAGLILCNTADLASATVTFGGDTTFAPSQELTRFVWDCS